VRLSRGLALSSTTASPTSAFPTFRFTDLTTSTKVTTTTAAAAAALGNLRVLSSLVDLSIGSSGSTVVLAICYIY